MYGLYPYVVEQLDSFIETVIVSGLVCIVLALTGVVIVMSLVTIV